MNLFSGLKGQAMQKEVKQVETVTISKAEYEELIDSQMWEEALAAAGVDNWEGYDEAREIYREMKEEYEG